MTPAWRKSSYSAVNGNCLEAKFTKSSYSFANGNCTEVALQDGAILVRDSKLDVSPVLSFSPQAWETFLNSIKA